MPTYVYRREDGTTFEIQQRITEPALDRCPETGQPVKRVISGNAGLIFKGSGFYLTDYARKNGNGASSNGASSNGASNGSSSESSPAKSSGSDASAKSETSTASETSTTNGSGTQS